MREVVDGVVDMNSNGTSMSKWYTVNVTGVAASSTTEDEGEPSSDTGEDGGVEGSTPLF